MSLALASLQVTPLTCVSQEECVLLFRDLKVAFPEVTDSSLGAVQISKGQLLWCEKHHHCLITWPLEAGKTDCTHTNCWLLPLYWPPMLQSPCFSLRTTLNPVLGEACWTLVLLCPHFGHFMNKLSHRTCSSDWQAEQWAKWAWFGNYQ